MAAHADISSNWKTETPKYVFLFFVCFFIFFPIYLMVNISLKNSAQIAKSPWFPSPTVEIVKVEAPVTGTAVYEDAELVLKGAGDTRRYIIHYDAALVLEWMRDEELHRIMKVGSGETAAVVKAAARLSWNGQGQLVRPDGSAVKLPTGFTPAPPSGNREEGVRIGSVVAVLSAPFNAQIDHVPGSYTFTGEDGEKTALVDRYGRPVPDMPVNSQILMAPGQKVIPGQIVFLYKQRLLFKWENYIEAYKYVLPFVWNTVVIAVTAVFFSLLFASLAAYAFARYDFLGKNVLFSMIVVLMMIPGVLNLIPMFVIVKNFPLFGGNNILGQGGHGLLDNLLVVILPAIAGSQIMNIYILRNFFEGIPEGLFESGRIDGASDLQMYYNICLPLSKPILGTLAIMAIVAQWNNYIWPLVTLKKESLMTITIGLAHLEGQFTSDYGLQMAGFALASIPLIILFLFTMKLFIKGIASGAIKF